VKSLGGDSLSGDEWVRLIGVLDRKKKIRNCILKTAPGNVEAKGDVARRTVVMRKNMAG